MLRLRLLAIWVPRVLLAARTVLRDKGYWKQALGYSWPVGPDGLPRMRLVARVRLAALALLLAAPALLRAAQALLLAPRVVV